MYRSSFDPGSRPLWEYKGYPVYLTTILTAAHVACLLAGAIIGFGRWESWFYLETRPYFFNPQLWRWITYPFVHQADIWFVLEMIVLYFSGRRIEQTFGRKALITLYCSLLLIPPLILQLIAYFGIFSVPLVGARLIHFPLLLGFCFIEPTAPFFTSHPAFQAKYVGSVLFILNLAALLGDRWGGWLAAFLINCQLTYIILRRNGLPPRFGALSEAFAAALPKRPKFNKSAPRSPVQVSPKSSAASPGGGPPGKYYEPKIKPKPDLYPEKQAVQEVDALLDKIARSGLDSLTPAERATLQRASARLKNPD